MKTVRIEVHGGVVTPTQLPQDTELVVHDRDVGKTDVYLSIATKGSKEQVLLSRGQKGDSDNA